MNTKYLDEIINFSGTSGSYSSSPLFITPSNETIGGLPDNCSVPILTDSILVEQAVNQYAKLEL